MRNLDDNDRLIGVNIYQLAVRDSFIFQGTSVQSSLDFPCLLIVYFLYSVKQHAAVFFLLTEFLMIYHYLKLTVKLSFYAITFLIIY